MIPKECRVYKVLKTILLLKPGRDNVVRFRYSNCAGMDIGGGAETFVKSAFFCRLYRLNKISPDFRIQPAKYILQVSRIDVRGNGNVDVRESVIFKMVGTHLF